MHSKIEQQTNYDKLPYTFQGSNELNNQLLSKQKLPCNHKLPETKEFRWNYFVGRARENLHIVLAMSPAGDNLRVRCRNFPGLISNTNVDWFFPWPEDALTAVANNFMGAVELEDDVRLKVTEHLVMVHQSV